MTEDQRQRCKESVTVAMREIESVLDVYGSELDYHGIHEAYEVWDHLRSLKWKFEIVSCYS